MAYDNAEQYNKTTNSLERKAHLNNVKKPQGAQLQGGVVARGCDCKGAHLQGGSFYLWEVLLVEWHAGGAASMHLMLSPVVCGA